MAASWRVGSLALAAALIWIAHHDRWTVEAWRLPTEYSGDAHEMLARIKAAAEGDTWPLAPQVIERLGAPFGAHWNAYPTPDKLLLLALGGLSHFVGLFAAANVGLMLAQVAAALAFYFVARWLRLRWEWAWAGALLFAFTYHSFHRGLAHFSFVFTWTVPLGLLAVWLVAQSRRLRWRSAGAVVCLGVAVAFGVSNPYNLFFWGQLLLWALVAQWCGARRWENLTIGLVTGVVALLACFAVNAELLLHVQEPEGLPLLARNYGGTERYALKPVEMFIPPEFHRLDFLAAVAHRYNRWSDWRGEAFLPYLGLAGMVGFGWLLVATVRRMLARRALPGPALPVAWLLSYATLGGVTNFLALFAGWQIFRATNRVAIFISALVLIFLVARLSRLTTRWPAGWRLAAALALAVIGVADQLPRPRPAERQAAIATDVRSDLALAREVEAALPRGAMVFQLPMLGFPEVLSPHQLADYEHFRPFLCTDSLRFSYGAAKFRARSRWQRDLENVPTETLVRRLESYGFAALYVNRKGYEDRAERLLRELSALGYARRIEGTRGNQVVVLLHPSSRPEKPIGQALTFGQGWHPRPENGVRWANRDGVLSFFNPHDRPLEVDLRFELIGVSPGEVRVRHQGRQVAAARLGSLPLEIALPRLKLEPGVNVFKLISSEPARRLGPERYQLRTFGLKSSSIGLVADAVAAP